MGERAASARPALRLGRVVHDHARFEHRRGLAAVHRPQSQCDLRRYRMGGERLCPHLRGASYAIGSACGSVWTTSDADCRPRDIHPGVAAVRSRAIRANSERGASVAGRGRRNRAQCGARGARARVPGRRASQGVRILGNGPRRRCRRGSARRRTHYLDVRLALGVPRQCSRWRGAHLARDRRRRRVSRSGRAETGHRGHAVVWRRPLLSHLGADRDQPRRLVGGTDAREAPGVRCPVCALCRGRVYPRTADGGFSRSFASARFSARASPCLASPPPLRS